MTRQDGKQRTWDPAPAGHELKAEARVGEGARELTKNPWERSRQDYPAHLPGP